MKLKLIHVEKTRETGKYISINKAGVFSFSKDLSQAIELSEGQKIDFYQDEENLKDWYFSIVENGQNIVRTGTKSEKYQMMMLNCSDMAKKIKTSLNFDISKTLRVPVGVVFIEGQQNYYPIITAAVKK